MDCAQDSVGVYSDTALSVVSESTTLPIAYTLCHTSTRTVHIFIYVHVNAKVYLSGTQGTTRYLYLVLNLPVESTPPCGGYAYCANPMFQYSGIVYATSLFSIGAGNRGILCGMYWSTPAPYQFRL